MNQVFWLRLICIFQIPLLSFAGVVRSDSCRLNCLETVAIPMMERAIVRSPQEIVSDLNCPPPGDERFDQVAVKSGPVLSSASIISGLVAQSASVSMRLQYDKNRCGPCKQNNIVSSYTTSAPQKIRTDVNCENSFVRNIQKELGDSEIEAFVKDTLGGKNSDGQILHRDCSNNCAYYVASAKTPLTQLKSRLNLTVFCGQGRQGSILTANYDYTVGFVHQWTCTR